MELSICDSIWGLFFLNSSYVGYQTPDISATEKHTQLCCLGYRVAENYNELEKSFLITGHLFGEQMRAGCMSCSSLCLGHRHVGQSPVG